MRPGTRSRSARIQAGRGVDHGDFDFLRNFHCSSDLRRLAAAACRRRFRGDGPGSAAPDRPAPRPVAACSKNSRQMQSRSRRHRARREDRLRAAAAGSIPDRLARRAPRAHVIARKSRAADHVRRYRIVVAAAAGEHNPR